VQLLLFVPWLNLGRRVCGSLSVLSGDAAALVGPLGMLRRFGAANLQALLAWLLTAPVATAVLFVLLHLSCRRLLPGRMP
jgi:hypothetical protein